MTRVVLTARDAAHAEELRALVAADGWSCFVRRDPNGVPVVVVPVSNEDQAETVVASLSIVVPAAQSMRVVPALRNLR